MSTSACWVQTLHGLCVNHTLGSSQVEGEETEASENK